MRGHEEMVMRDHEEMVMRGHEEMVMRGSCREGHEKVMRSWP